MYIAVAPERLDDLSSRLKRVSGSLQDIERRLQRALNHLDWETRQKPGIQGNWHRVQKLSQNNIYEAEAMASFLAQRAHAFREADRQGVNSLAKAVCLASVMQSIMQGPLGALISYPFKAHKGLINLGGIVGGVLMTVIPFTLPIAREKMSVKLSTALPIAAAMAGAKGFLEKGLNIRDLLHYPIDMTVKAVDKFLFKPYILNSLKSTSKFSKSIEEAMNNIGKIRQSSCNVGYYVNDVKDAINRLKGLQKLEKYLLISEKVCLPITAAFEFKASYNAYQEILPDNSPWYVQGLAAVGTGCDLASAGLFVRSPLKIFSLGMDDKQSEDYCNWVDKNINIPSLCNNVLVPAGNWVADKIVNIVPRSVIANSIL